MSRRARIAVALLVVAALAMPSVASAANEAALRAKLRELQAKSAAAGKEYMSAYWELDETEVQLAKTNKRIAKARKELKAAKRKLNGRANSIYRREQLDMLGFLLAATSFEELVTRADYMARIGSADADAVAEVKSIRAKLLAERTLLREERARRAKTAAVLRKRRNALQAKLRSTQSEYKRVRAQLDASRAGGRLPSGVSAMPGPNGMVFPVVGSYYYSNTWGASRSGGRRRHRGTDIMAPRGTPCVAVASGTVRAKSNGLGGRTIWLTADNGWQFYYAHLDRWVVRSGRVRAGQVIGTVGSTGNAQGGSPHLHFQMHPGGGAPVNPYPYLRSME